LGPILNSVQSGTISETRNRFINVGSLLIEGPNSQNAE
jgi:hypothetical protein